MILQSKKSHTDKRFRFRDFLQYVTVSPIFSESVDVPSESSESYWMFPVNIYVNQKVCLLNAENSFLSRQGHNVSL